MIHGRESTTEKGAFRGWACEKHATMLPEAEGVEERSHNTREEAPITAAG